MNKFKLLTTLVGSVTVSSFLFAKYYIYPTSSVNKPLTKKVVLKTADEGVSKYKSAIIELRQEIERLNQKIKKLRMYSMDISNTKKKEEIENQIKKLYEELQRKLKKLKEYERKYVELSEEYRNVELSEEYRRKIQSIPTKNLQYIPEHPIKKLKKAPHIPEVARQKEKTNYGYRRFRPIPIALHPDKLYQTLPIKIKEKIDKILEKKLFKRLEKLPVKEQTKKLKRLRERLDKILEKLKQKRGRYGYLNRRLLLRIQIVKYIQKRVDDKLEKLLSSDVETEEFVNEILETINENPNEPNENNETSNEENVTTNENNETSNEENVTTNENNETSNEENVTTNENNETSNEENVNK